MVSSTAGEARARMRRYCARGPPQLRGAPRQADGGLRLPLRPPCTCRAWISHAASPPPPPPPAAAAASTRHAIAGKGTKKAPSRFAGQCRRQSFGEQYMHECMLVRHGQHVWGGRSPARGNHGVPAVGPALRDRWRGPAPSPPKGRAWPFRCHCPGCSPPQRCGRHSTAPPLMHLMTHCRGITPSNTSTARDID